MVAWWRYLFGGLLLLPIFWQMRLGAFRTGRLGHHLTRNFVHTVGLWIWFYALPMMPIAETTALGFTTPLFITIGAVLFLGEVVRIRRWMALIVGFLGTLIILRPGMAELSAGALLMLSTAPIFAASNLMSKALSRTDHTNVIVVHQTMMITLFLLPPAIWFWQTPSWEQILWLAIAGVIGTAGHWTMTQSFKVAEITAVQPIGFLTLVWATLAGYLMFGDVPDLWTWIGASIIFASATYISRREAKLKGRAELAGTAPPAAH